MILLAALLFVGVNIGVFVWALWLDHRVAVHERQSMTSDIYYLTEHDPETVETRTHAR
jgi:hypothetical protein